jgi:hypothetical protein
MGSPCDCERHDAESAQHCLVVYGTVSVSSLLLMELAAARCAALSKQQHHPHNCITRVIQAISCNIVVLALSKHLGQRKLHFPRQHAGVQPTSRQRRRVQPASPKQVVMQHSVKIVCALTAWPPTSNPVCIAVRSACPRWAVYGCSPVRHCMLPRSCPCSPYTPFLQRESAAGRAAVLAPGQRPRPRRVQPSCKNAALQPGPMHHSSVVCRRRLPRPPACRPPT